MTLKSIEYGYLAVKGIPTYTCDACGKQANGTTVSSEFRGGFGLSEVEGRLHGWLRNTTNSHMPLNWASYGNRTHKCPECKE